MVRFLIGNLKFKLNTKKNPLIRDNWIINDEFTMDLKLDIWGHEFPISEGFGLIEFLDKIHF